jgi:hypothetical protein
MMVASNVPVSSSPSLLIIETGASILACALAFGWPRALDTGFARIELAAARLARRPKACVLGVGMAAMILRLCALPLIAAPQPFVHDEFSFLLAGDTFASGRLTNPTHPMWRHFESFHITQNPTYMSMYFPAQGLVLAAGQVLTGNPWYGICASAALMCSAICWMLQGWMPPAWALFGGVLAIFRLALFSNWVNGFYGGAVAAIGGSLVLGALPRVIRKARVSDGLLMALGIALLANTRPWEGVLLCAPVACALIWWLATELHPPAIVMMRRASAPLILLAATAAGMGWYNYRVFGDPLTLPYQVNRATYASAPVFLWQAPRPQPAYRHKVMREFYSNWELGDFLRARTVAGFVSNTIQKLGVTIFFFYGTALFVPLVILPWALRDGRVRFLVVASAIYAVGLCLNAWLFPHYLAPLTSALYALLLQSMRHLRAWRQPYGRALVRFIPVLCLALTGLRLVAAPIGIAVDRWPAMWYGTEPLGLNRARVAAELEGRPGRHLAIVRYSEVHSVFDDWVYNAADIDRANVVWAREMDATNNARLLKYFDRRHAWLVEPDSSPPRISPYPVPGAGGGSR